MESVLVVFYIVMAFTVVIGAVMVMNGIYYMFFKPEASADTERRTK